MVDILHRVGIKAPASEVYAALTTVGGLAGWWTADTKGVGDEVGGVALFRFKSDGFDMKVRELQPDTRVDWEVVGGPKEWIGTHVTWDLDRADDQTIVLFRHTGWAEPVEFMHHCSTKWAVFLMSLKSLVETGKGAPYPDDVHIDNWG
ncbi:SRPBCC domain-containing protein [Nonomuraea sp. NPDC050790]|uniref:SRPBCC domain-containing protein n=1 Tax=Nonomuraea sp. NPDC050790 TaxID=3364371 RepID=UPI0037948227